MKNSIPFGFWFFILIVLVISFVLWRGYHRVAIGLAVGAGLAAGAMVGRLFRR